jgi:hypothetical protein
MPGSDSSQYTAFKRYSSALVDARADNKTITHLYTFNPSVPTALGASKFLPSLTLKNISVLPYVRVLRPSSKPSNLSCR